MAAYGKFAKTGLANYVIVVNSFGAPG